MNDRIEPDLTISVRLGGEEQLINRIYDNVHLFDWLGHGILKLVTTEGFLQWHTTYDTAVDVANSAGITPVYRPEITPKEYDQYLEFQEYILGDEWLT